MLLRRFSPSPLPHGPSSRLYSNATYASTLKNLEIGSHTRVIFQGFTGRQATANAIESLAWGTQVVGGVTPGRDGMHPVLKDLPVLPTVKDAMRELKPDATGIYVAANQAADAIEEAIEAEVPLIVAVAEHIPVHDMLRIHSMLQSQSKSRLVGANAPGIISAIGRCRIGFQPLPAFSAGHVGIVAKSGTLSYETVAALTRAGVGQSLCIGMGGDMVAGTDFVDALNVFEHHEDTHGIIIVGEIGGYAEEEAAEWIKEYRKRCSSPKPIAAVVGGHLIKPGYVMGHAGAWIGRGQNSAKDKYKALESAGVTMVDHPSQFGQVMARALKVTPSRPSSPSSSTSQRRKYHTSSHRPPLVPQPTKSQRRALHLPARHAETLLTDRGIPLTRTTIADSDQRLLAITIDRSSRAPSFLACPTTDPGRLSATAKYFPFDFSAGYPTSIGKALVNHLFGGTTDDRVNASVSTLALALYDIFIMHEGLYIGVKISLPSSGSDLLVHEPEFIVDDSALKSGSRHAELHALRDVSPAALDPAELRAEADGIVYVKLGMHADSQSYDLSYNIGTLVNGAGLAMNTVDALALRGGRAANFLDTGGKATSETVKRSFELLLADERVKVIFVNIFGGLTLGDMIARGILLAFQELGLEKKGVPVVVRIRGTNEEEGQRILKESGLNIWAFDGFDEAAAKCVELARDAGRR